MLKMPSARGAAVVFAPQGSAAQIEGGGLVVELDDFRHAAGRAAARFYGHPSRAMYTIGVTGTNGKTSVCWWLQQLLSLLGEKVGSVGTLGVRSSVDEAFDNTGFTTPLAADLQAILADVRTKGTQTLVLEASSHGIEQGRISGCNFNQAVFTNLTQDHLDFHPSMEAYAATKKKLFSWPDLRGMTVNIDDLVGQEIWSQGAAVERVSYALENPQADVRPAQLPIQRGAYQTGLEFEIVSPWGSGSLYCPHVQGKHNAYNVLAVIAVAGQKGYPLDRLLDAAQALTPPPGRLQSAIPPFRASNRGY